MPHRLHAVPSGPDNQPAEGALTTSAPPSNPKHPWLPGIVAAFFAAGLTAAGSTYTMTRVQETQLSTITTKVGELAKDAKENGNTLVEVRTTLEQGLRPRFAEQDRRMAQMEAALAATNAQLAATNQRLAETIGVLAQVQASIEAILRSSGMSPPLPPARPR